MVHLAPKAFSQKSTWVLAGLLPILAGCAGKDPLTFPEIRALQKQGQIRNMKVYTNEITGDYVKNGALRPFSTPFTSGDLPLVKFLDEHKIEYTFHDYFLSSRLAADLRTYGFAVLLSLWSIFSVNWILRQRSKQPRKKKGASLSFKDVAISPEVRREVQDIIDFLKNPKKISSLGGRMPKGILMAGEPGNGKTRLAQAIAGEAGIPFYEVNLSVLEDSRIGMGADHVRDICTQAIKNAPAIVFLNEIDAIGKKRSTASEDPGGGLRDSEQTLVSLLTFMDGYETSPNVIFIGDTNRLELLDEALRRPGRFDRVLTVPNPTEEIRGEILKIHTRKMKLARDVDFAHLSKLCPGFSGAQIEAWANEAAIVATREQAKAVAPDHFNKALVRIRTGLKKPSLLVNAQQRHRIGVARMGRVVVTMALNETDPILQVSILATDRSLGSTLQLPPKDRFLYSRNAILAEICGLLGSRAAEMLVFKEESTLTAVDMNRASELATQMLQNYGMGKEGLELRVFSADPHTHVPDYSMKTRQQIQAGVQHILFEQMQRAASILANNQSVLEEWSRQLMAEEVLHAGALAKLKNSIVMYKKGS